MDTADLTAKLLLLNESQRTLVSDTTLIKLSAKFRSLVFPQMPKVYHFPSRIQVEETTE